MQKSFSAVMLFISIVLLSACNLGANAVQQTTEVLEQPTTNIAVATREDPTTPTPFPTQEPISNNSNSNPIVTCSPHNDWLTYTIVGGDTLSRIAARGNTNVNTLVTANCLSDANVISPGQILRVPNPVVIATPIIVTSTPVPQTNTACRITMTQEHLSYFDQTYQSMTQILNTGEGYLITGHNAWNYRIQLSAAQEAWLQKSIPETPAGDCGNVPQVGLAYRQMGATRTNICYFIPAIDNFSVYYDQAQTRSDFSMPGNQYYLIDARASNLYRIVGSDNLGYPGWVSANLGRIEGNCEQIPDYAVATTLNTSSITFSDPNFKFAFEYPSNWLLESFTDGMSGYRLGTAPRWRGYPGAVAWPDDIVEVSFIWLDTGQFDTARAYAEYIVADIRANPSRIAVIQDPALFTTNSGLETYHIIVGGVWANTHQYIFLIDNRIYLLAIQGNQSHAVRVIDSLRAA